MLSLVNNAEIKDLSHKLAETRKENKQLREQLKNSNLEIGEWKSKIILLESEIKTLNKKLEKEMKKNDNA